MPHRQLTEKIPAHLGPFIAKQDASLYTAIDHASWRFILRISKAYFSGHAHQKYVDGLRETGISTERIPLIEEMDQCLRRFGWRAVPVSGFIPPAAFMEFQSLGILPIACEMRTLDHLAYTPAPDIVHEAAGHAPILADPEYAAYLRNYGEVSRKAIFSHEDQAIYEAVRALSDIKEDPASREADITRAQKQLDAAVASASYVSEANQLARMNWWTVEYGLVGKPEKPLIYGAGLLSSVGESYNCLSDEVQKIPFTLDCVNTSYDITRPQPQLYVVRDFRVLTEVLEEFAKTMAYRQGGVRGLAKAKMARSVCTVALDSGVQISGVLSGFLTDEKGEPSFLKFSGPCQLARGDHELPNQGPKFHAEGFSAPIGPIKSGKLEGLKVGDKVSVEYASGIRLVATLAEPDAGNGVLSFKDCTITNGAEVLYRPEWGKMDLAVGVRVTSVFGGAADRQAYVEGMGGFKQKPRAPKTNLTNENRDLTALYAKVRELREKSFSVAELKKVHDELEKKHPNDWLLRMEILELVRAKKELPELESKLSEKLWAIAGTAKDKRDMIQRGMELIA